MFFHTSNLSQIQEVTSKLASFRWGQVWALASVSTVAPGKDAIHFWGESLTKLSFALKSSHRKDVFFSISQITVLVDHKAYLSRAQKPGQERLLMQWDLFVTFLEKNIALLPEECICKCISPHTLRNDLSLGPGCA